MSQWERPASGSSAAVAAAPGVLGAERPNGVDSSRPLPPRWEEIFQGASPSQQQELLTLAGRQGLLYAHQLPPANGSRHAPASGVAQRVAHFLEGHPQELAPVSAPGVAMLDQGLDAGQREAVARALATPDVCLIQGLPGTGKSRVAAEIIAQAAGRGERVLLLASTPPALDRILHFLRERDVICAVRCLTPEENAECLPPWLRDLTFPEKVRSLREHSVQCARRGQEQAEERCRRRQQESSRWPRLLELAESLERLEQARMALRNRHAGMEEEVRQEAAALENSGEVPCMNEFHAALDACRQARDRELTQLDAALETASKQQADCHQSLEHLQALAEPLRRSRQQTHWWSFARLRTLFTGNIAARLARLEGEIASARATFEERAQEVRRLTSSRASSAEAAQQRLAALLQQQTRGRQDQLHAQEEALAHEAALLMNKWEDLNRELDPGEVPVAATAAAVLAARDAWQVQAASDEERCTFARQWSNYLADGAEALAERLPGYINLVAATTAALPADPHFGDAAAGRQTFDLLVLEEATHLSESAFVVLAGRAARWILIGLPAAAAETAPSAKSAAGKSSRSAPGLSGTRTEFFQRLWQHLHADPSGLPYAWVQEGERICCRLRPVAPEQRRWLECERVADFPEIELRILTLPRQPPVLAEVLFPATMTVHQAKEYLYRELQEFPVQAPGRSMVWVEVPEQLTLRLSPTPAADAQPVALENGVREWVGRAPAEQLGLHPTAVWHTCRIEFDRNAGWDRARAEAWVRDHLQIRDPGRTAYLEVPYRMTPPLAAVLWDVLFEEFRAPGREMADHAPAVEFVAVPPLTHGRGQRERIKRGGPRGLNTLTTLSALPRSGAGLELDLAVPRHAERLPPELRANLPRRGLVNYLEAQAIVRRLENLISGGQATGNQIAVIALYPAQVELLRRMLQNSPTLRQASPPVQVDLPSGLRQQEFDIVLVSLTRSNALNAVSFGEGPQALTLALTRACRHLVLFGDVGTCVRRSQWQGALEHLDESAAARVAQVFARLVGYLQGHGWHATAFHVNEGSKI
jgi:hypothetical protein